MLICNLLRFEEMSQVKVYHLKDPAQYADEKTFWAEQSIAYKLEALERIRASWDKMGNKAATDERFHGLRRVLRVVERA